MTSKQTWWHLVILACSAIFACIQICRNNRFFQAKLNSTSNVTALYVLSPNSFSNVMNEQERIQQYTIPEISVKSSVLINPRVWKSLPINNATICFQPTKEKVMSATDSSNGFPVVFPYTWLRKKNDSRMFRRGFLFIKPMKVGGSTASGVLLRVAKNLATRLQKNFSLCDGVYDHTRGSRFGTRILNESFLLSLIREPTKRSISQFYHFEVSRKGVEPTLENFRRITSTKINKYRNYYIRIHTKLKTSTTLIQAYNQSMIAIIQDILNSHDFLAITERFDESMVVLQMLWDVPLGDMLYLKAKTSGGYDGGGQNCTFILPWKDLPKDIANYIQSDKWKDTVKWDTLLYQAVNYSLDATIEAIGRSKFEEQLQRFQHAQQVNRERCSGRAIYPCSVTGERRKPAETNCLFRDSGCGYQCMDEVAKELNLL